MEKIYNQIKAYSPENKNEKKFRKEMLQLLNARNTNAFLRSNKEAHFTASAWLVSSDHQHVLLLHHKKLDLWLQPGGHADGITDLEEVSFQELIEETGIKKVKRYSSEIFDLDIHQIPQRKNEEAHLHYDVRYLYICEPEQEVQINHESKDYVWLPLNQIIQDFSNRSIVRMAKKTSILFNEE